jgi:hypothetical protein
MNLADQKSLISDLAKFEHDPWGYVQWAYPWGRPGPLEKLKPHKWQRDSLCAMRDRMRGWGSNTEMMLDREADIAGNGNGKSAKSAWVLEWAMMTKRNTRGFVTSGTADQLSSKFWPELDHWHSLNIARPFFTLTATAYFSAYPDDKMKWRVDMQPWNKSHPESGAGMHNKGGRIIKLFEESSQIPDIVWQTAEGSNTDTYTEIIHHVNGNGTRNNGRFAEITYLKPELMKLWNPVAVDCRTVEGANMGLFEEWIREYGEDSDFCRAHIFGKLVRSSALQFILGEFLEAAESRWVEWQPDDPLVGAIDPARGGDDTAVIRFRYGVDMRTFPAIRIPGSEVRDSNKLEAKIFDICRNPRIYGLPRAPDVWVIDAVGIGGPIFNHLEKAGLKILPFDGSLASPDREGPHGTQLYRNMRTYSWARLRDALRNFAAVDQDPYLQRDIRNQEATLDDQDKLMLVKKKTMKGLGLPSPDDGDSAAMLWAFHIPQLEKPKSAWDKMAQQRNKGRVYSLKDRLNKGRTRARFTPGWSEPQRKAA